MAPFGFGFRGDIQLLVDKKHKTYKVGHVKMHVLLLSNIKIKRGHR